MTSFVFVIEVLGRCDGEASLLSIVYIDFEIVLAIVANDFGIDFCFRYRFCVPRKKCELTPLFGSRRRKKVESSRVTDVH